MGGGIPGKIRGRDGGCVSDSWFWLPFSQSKIFTPENEEDNFSTSSSIPGAIWLLLEDRRCVRACVRAPARSTVLIRQKCIVSPVCSLPQWVGEWTASNSSARIRTQTEKKQKNNINPLPLFIVHVSRRTSSFPPGAAAVSKDL